MLFVGDDWAEDHHDVEVQDAAGGMRTARLPEGVDGMARFHELIGLLATTPARPGAGMYRDRPRAVGAGAGRGRLPGLRGEPETGRPAPRGPVTVGRQERQGRRAHPGRHGPDPLPPAAPGRRRLRLAEAVKVVARAHQTLIWERTRHTLRLRAALRDYFPAALAAYQLMTSPASTPSNCWQRRPPGRGGEADHHADQRGAEKGPPPRHSRQGRRDPAGTARRAPGPGRVVACAYAATVRATVAILEPQHQIRTLDGQVEAHFGQHPDAEVYLSQPGIGVILGARVLAEFGDAPGRYADAKSRKNYAGTARSPASRARPRPCTPGSSTTTGSSTPCTSGRRATSAPGVRAYYDEQRAREVGHNAALRQIGNRLVGILHGCLKTRSTTTRPPPGHTAPTPRQHDGREGNCHGLRPEHIPAARLISGHQWSLRVLPRARWRTWMTGRENLTGGVVNTVVRSRSDRAPHDRPLDTCYPRDTEPPGTCRLPYSPRVLGIDEHDREVLTYLEGTPAMRPWPRALRARQGPAHPWPGCCGT